MLELLVLIVFPGLMALAAASDLVTMTISNWVSIVLVAGFAVLALFMGLSLEAIGLHLLVGFGALVAGFLCFAAGWIGGGDAKLFAASALWFGMQDVLAYALTAAVFGGALTLVLVFFKGAPLPYILYRQFWIYRLNTLEDGIPYGLALAGAGLAVYPQSIWMAHLAG